MSLALLIQTPLTIEGGSTCQKSTHTESIQICFGIAHPGLRFPFRRGLTSREEVRVAAIAGSKNEKSMRQATLSRFHIDISCGCRELASPRSALNIKRRLNRD